MKNDHGIPNGWAMPDDLAKKVSKILNKKKVTPEDEVADALEELARDIALIEPDPEDWEGWVIYFLDQLEVGSKKRRREFEFNSFQDHLVNELQDRKRNNR